MAALRTMALSRSAEALVQLFVLHADREGLYWGQVTGEVQAVTGLAPQTIRVLARQLRAEGLIDWRWVRPHKRFPRRSSYEKPAALGKGFRDAHGGRVWVLKWPKLGVNWTPRDLGTALACENVAGVSERDRLIPGDQSGLIPGDQSTSDLLASLNPIPRLQDIDAPPRAPLPSSRPLGEVASETPSAPAAAIASQNGPSPAEPKPEPEKEPKGKGPDSREAGGEPEAPWTVGRIEAELAFLFKPGTGTAARRSNAKKPPEG